MDMAFASMARIDSHLLADLRTQTQGEIIVPGDANYDRARMAWNLSVDQHPEVIVVARSAADVSAAVRFARAARLGVAIQSTGHGVARPANDAVLIITSNLKEICVDADSGTAWIEAGLKWGEVLKETQAVGLAPLLGSSPGVGVVGYTLGGGMGWLARKYGLATDSVRYFEVVTVDGDLVRASATENSDLFWGLRGGGGNFGVVTGMEIQLYPVAEVYGGSLIYPGETAQAALQHFREWIKTAPEELTSSIAIMNFPPLPELPEFMRGRTVVMIHACYSGPVEQGEAYIQPWLEWMPPIVNGFHAMPFLEVGTISNDPVDPSPGISSGMWLADLSDEAIDIIVKHAVSVNGSSPIVKTEIRHAGGAISRVDPQASAYSHRDETLIMQCVSITPTAEAFEISRQFMHTFKGVLAAHLTNGVYLNFLDGEDAREQTRNAYSAQNFDRLQVLKAKYDPDNLFNHSFDIPPVEEEDVDL